MDKCVMCGEAIPEGRHVCVQCEYKIIQKCKRCMYEGSRACLKCEYWRAKEYESK